MVGWEPAVAHDGGVDDGGDGAPPDVGVRGGPGGPDLRHLTAIEAELADVEHAMGRLDAGTWGTCEVCGATIDRVALSQRPAARTCAVHV